VVAVGGHKATNSPAFVIQGTGFAVGNGSVVATNAHVINVITSDAEVTVMVQVRLSATESQLRPAKVAVVDKEHDLALLRIEGPPLPPASLGDSEGVREGQEVAFTGFPIGSVMGFFPVTHRGMVSAVTPVAIPVPNSQKLSEKLIHRMRQGSFPIFQLDAVAYPGNSGSPIFSPETGEVLGVINMVVIKSTKEAALAQPSGITYAVPVAFLKSLLAGLGR